MSEELTEAQKKNYERLLHAEENRKWWSDLENNACYGGGAVSGLITGVASFAFGAGVPGFLAGASAGCVTAIGAVRTLHKLNEGFDDVIEHGNKKIKELGSIIPEVPALHAEFATAKKLKTRS